MELKATFIDNIKYKYNPQKSYEKDGHIYCRSCHERIDSDPIDFIGNRKVILTKACSCIELERKMEEENEKKLKIKQMKDICFKYTPKLSQCRFEGIKNHNRKEVVTAKRYVDKFKEVEEKNIGLLFVGNVGSGKSYLCGSIANAIIEVSTVIVKDMSRFGRDYLKVGFYTEILFKEKGVRFIAINNGIDSEKQTESDFTPFLNIMNEWYARDTSRKIQSIFRARMEEGKRVSSSVPYGYYRNPKNKQELLVDKESAEVVKRIYRLVIEGYGVTQIAGILTKDKILIPSAYAEIHYPENNHSSKKRGIEDLYFWTPTTISHILAKKEYMGHTVLGKTICLDYKTKKRRKVKEDELIIFKNTHKAIIDEETWNNAQRLRKTVRRSPKYGTTSHPFTGLLICADCGGKLSYREPAEHKKKKYDYDYCFVCQHYRHRKGNCSIHYIKVKTVNEILLKSIKEITNFAKEDKQEFLKVMNKLSDEKREERYQVDKEKLEKLSSRNEELTILITKLYEDHALGKIPVKHFDRLFNIYDTEQQDLEKKYSILNKK